MKITLTPELAEIIEKKVRDGDFTSADKAVNTLLSYIIAGLTPHQYKQLEALGIARAMDIENLCPDLEFAIARGMALTHSMAV